MTESQVTNEAHVRRRHVQFSLSSSEEDRGMSTSSSLSSKLSRAETQFSGWLFLLLCLYIVSLYSLCVYMDHRLPEALTPSTAPSDDVFIESNARTKVRRLTSIGARPSGSYENEVLAVNWLKQEIDIIAKRISAKHHKLTVDIQKPRGSFNLDFLDGVTHHYRDITNVIVKLEPNPQVAQHSLLVNCHFDSVAQSPGASDDAVSCGIMLEVLDALVRSRTELRHSIVFLFNGAEENMLPASHGFITQHNWASSIRAFLNLESCGAGGRELVFQSGPGNPWMIETYGKVAPHPFASVIGQEIFQSGIFPGDTDFRVFRDFGHIPGLDIAYMKNGYVYHTEFDTEDRIPSGSIQRAGDNVLAVVKHLVQSELLVSANATDSGPSTVFFDVLGLTLIWYSEDVGSVVNIIIALLAIAHAVRQACNAHHYGVTRRLWVDQLFYSFVGQLCSLLAALFCVTLTALILDCFGRAMSWYARPYIIAFLYVCPAVFGVVIVFHFLKPKQKKWFKYVGGEYAVESLHFEVCLIIWATLTLVLTLMRVKSSFFCMVFTLFPLVGRACLDQIYDKSPAQRKLRDWKWLLFHLLSLLVPLLLLFYLVYATFTMFIPVLGRSGSTINPELIIGLKSCIFTMAGLSYVGPLVFLIRNTQTIASALYSISITFILMVMFTSLGFPYSDDASNFAPHRGFFVHVRRDFFGKNTSLEKSDSGYFVINLDRNSPQLFYNLIPEYLRLEDVSEEMCDEHLYCGMPIYYPAMSMLSRNHWIRAPRPKTFNDVELNLVEKQQIDQKHWRLLFSVQGSDHMGVYMSPARGVSLSTWSFSEGQLLPGPTWKDGRPTYYIFYSRGLRAEEWHFWIELEVSKTFIMDEDDLLDLAVVSHVLHGHGMKTPIFKAFLDQFPKWSYNVGWTAVYMAFKF